MPKFPDTILLSNIKKKLPELKELLKETTSDWNYEDLIYRFYHTSYKVYGLQEITTKIVKSLKELQPDSELNPFFVEIITAGTNIKFQYDHNQEWSKHTRPIVEAFLHAKYFLEMTVKYGKQFNKPPSILPSGYAAILELYMMR